MKDWKHLTLEQRKAISNGISHNYKLKDIAKTLGFDPTSISKEVKRNRENITVGKNITNCNKTNRWPFVCTGCKNKYNNQCCFTKYKYDAVKAQRKANINLINSRKGIDIDSDKFCEIDSIIKNGVDDKKSIYQITIENKDTIDKSVTTLYRYVNKGYLTTTRTDLPYAVTYKKRKHNKKYEYSENKNIDRTGHTYIDYLAYIHKHPGIYVWQLDFLGTIKTDNNNILSFILPNLQFIIIDLIKNPNQDKIVEFFDELEEKIGTNAFIELIPVILTDRDPSFTDIESICFSKITGEERCKLYFCDSYVSNQKPNVENMNKQLRLFFPKGKTIDNYTKNDIKNINKTLLNIPLKSLDSYSAKDAFINVFDEELFNKLF
ncbi:MAG: helix-turn-helix domain-containing protein [Eubacteriales bacterium]|nr:helix-turn-helix domain-containing protein [Eubacteriales bacterium]